MNILLNCIHYPVCSGRYMTGAFERAGHTVRHVGPPQGRQIWGLDLPASYAWEPQTPDGFTPDLVVVMDSDPAILDNLPTFDAPMVVYGVDNHVRDYRRKRIDHYFLAHRVVSLMRWDVTPIAFEEITYTRPRIDMTHLPCAYDPTIFTPSPIAYEDRDYDVCMIGVMYPGRWMIVNALRKAGVKVLAGTGLVYEGYRDAYHNARISLCVSANHDVAQRIFETAAMGCVVLSDPCPDFDRLNADGIVTYQLDSIVQDVKTLLAQPTIAKAHIERSMAWAAPHTWDARVKVIEAWGEKERAVESKEVS